MNEEIDQPEEPRAPEEAAGGGEDPAPAPRIDESLQAEAERLKAAAEERRQAAEDLREQAAKLREEAAKLRETPLGEAPVAPGESPDAEGDADSQAESGGEDKPRRRLFRRRS
jgi:hypothetical protein